MNERTDTTLSTADLANAAEQQSQDRAAGPKYVEGEEAATVRADGTTGSPAPAADVSTTATDGHGSTEAAPLLADDVAQDLRSRWSSLQNGFVDEPRRSVEQADGLVAEAIKRLAETFAHERQSLEQQWDRGDDINTEDLRIALTRYRSFFERLLSA